ncbi:MAG: nitrile hydratase subunit beta [Acidimicrobiales bacterium]
MDGIHDMGGTEGYGPVPYVADEKVQVTSRWEAFSGAAMFALLRSGKTNIDAHRHRIERLDPTRYLPISYWGRWLAAIESAVTDQGIADRDEVDRAITALGHAPDEAAPPPRMHPVVALESRHNDPTFTRELDRPRRFSVGDRVTTMADAPQAGHHRLPRYARGRSGTVVRAYPAFTFPDAVAHNRGEQPTYVYAVGFSGRELWGADGDPNQICHLDVFEPYLSPDSSPAPSPATSQTASTETEIEESFR